MVKSPKALHLLYYNIKNINIFAPKPTSFRKNPKFNKSLIRSLVCIKQNKNKFDCVENLYFAYNDLIN